MPNRLSIAIAALLTAGCLGALPAMAQDINFGDDSGLWTSDGECDDPRFQGPGMASATDPTGEMTDSTDCQKAFREGRITLIGGGAPNADAPAADDGPAVPEGPEGGGIDFGGDTTVWINDGECDDPRFDGPGMSAAPVEADIMGDATDCQALYMAGEVFLDGAVAPGADGGDTPAPAAGGIDFGGDTAVWTNDGECDDPRFEGPGMSALPAESDIMGDATDCRTLFESGQVTLAGDDTPAPAADDFAADGTIDFGDDTGVWINDGECDDPRFQGPGMAEVLVETDIKTDATDCRTLFDAGQVTLAGAGTTEPAGDDAPPAVKPGNGDAAPTGTVDFGDDTSPWINDGECDDPRFEGPGMATGLDPSNTMADATDCRTLFDAGRVTMAGAGGPAKPGPASPGPVGAVDFGADSGQWTNDGECDDPRFAGTGMAEVLEDADLFADATDCKTLFDAGMITLAGDGGDAAPAVDFGADSGEWTNDGECDDPRFIGTGMAAELVDADLFADATDCKTLFDAGMITLR